MNRASPSVLTLSGLALAGATWLAFSATIVSAEDRKMPMRPVRPAAFTACAGCHTTEPGQSSYGPSLSGISGRRAGIVPGYPYSGALKSSGVTWNAATLDRWLTSPQRMVPGTRMPFAGISDPASRRQVVDYLLTLR